MHFFLASILPFGDVITTVYWYHVRAPHGKSQSKFIHILISLLRKWLQLAAWFHSYLIIKDCKPLSHTWIFNQIWLFVNLGHNFFLHLLLDCYCSRHSSSALEMNLCWILVKIIVVNSCLFMICGLQSIPNIVWIVLLSLQFFPVEYEFSVIAEYVNEISERH